MKTLSVEEIKGSLTSGKRTAIMGGCLLLMFAVAVFGVSISTVLAQLLDSMNAASEFSLVTLLASVATCLMTPVGGRISDMIGTKNVILTGGLIAAASALVMPFITSVIPFIIARFMLGVGLGLYMASPYTLLYEIFDRSKVPSMMGLLGASLAFGGMVGGLIAGFFADNGLMWLALVYPVVFVLPGALLVYFMLPQKHLQKSKFDIVGFLLLAAGLTLLFLGLNEGPKTGWFQLSVLAEVFGGLILLTALYFYEKKCSYALIPVRLFAQKEFSLLLVIGFLLVFFITAVISYVPLGMQKIMGVSSTVTGLIQVPRSLLAMILPFPLGIWIVKKADRTWKALTVSSLAIVIPFSLLVFIGPNMPVWFVFAVVAITGLSEAFKGVSITPAAQSLLAPQDLGVGTALLSFINTLAGVIAGAALGAAYDAITGTDPSVTLITRGIDTVFLITAVTGLAAFVLVFFVFRPIAEKRAAKKAAQAQAQTASVPAADAKTAVPAAGSAASKGAAKGKPAVLK